MTSAATISSPLPADSPSAPRHQRHIAIWLLLVCTMIFGMVILGGVTRLTGSGLSMVSWNPIMGVIPPLSDAQWQHAFEQYQQFPEYKDKNLHMDVHQFKSIFWFEYAHRLLGRLIGVAFFVPFLYFLVRRRFSRNMVPQLVTMFLLGAFQGLLGWYMVKSGLVNQPRVSQYRLTAHLGTALVIYAYILWTALGLILPRGAAVARGVRRYSIGLTLFIFLTALSGGFVAGLKAGFAYNTFPLMDGHWIPSAYGVLDPKWRNLFENIAAVQFDHRLLATLLFFTIIGFWLYSRNKVQQPRIRVGIHLLLLMAILQVTLGISTLLLHVPVPLAASHQAGALTLFTIAIYVARSLHLAGRAPS